MSPPKAVAVVGFKGAGKTRVVEALVRELSRRGYRVGTLKHASGEHPLDTPGKDTYRHREAGSYSTAILTSKGSAVYLNHPVDLSEIIPLLGPVDFIILEGFKSLDTVARIIVPIAPGDLEPLSNGLEIAVVPPSGVEAPLYEKDIPVFPISRIGELVDLILGKAFPILPGLDCGSCGYEGCKALAKAILAGKATAERCTALFGGGVRLKVDGKTIPLNPFVRSFMGNVVLGMVRTLKGVERPKGIEISLDVGELEWMSL
ncbi:MAG: molybdopterin-guanine dinucleotide biosynthesis protein B [Candidatus Bathyarchaeia archaeon]